MPTDPKQLRAELESRALTMLGAFVPVALKNPSSHAEGQARALQTARLLAAVAHPDDPPRLVLADENGVDPVRTQNAGHITREMGMSDAEWQTFARGAEQIARAVKDETGLSTVFHHHCAGWVETPDEIARFLQITDPALVGLVFDTGHYVFGSGVSDGAVVLDALNRFGDRIWYIHLKDCEPRIAARARVEGWDYITAIRHGVFCELGKGGVDFPAVVEWLRARDYRGWVLVEQDVLPGRGTPKESAQRNRDYLRALGI
jgi:inosose dehydratase